MNKYEIMSLKFCLAMPNCKYVCFQMPQLVIVKGGMNEVEESKPDLDANRRSQRVVVVRGAARSAAVKQNTAVSGQSLVLVAAERNL